MLPDPRLTLVYRLEATVAQPLDLGETAEGHRRIVALTGGTFTGPELNGKLLPDASADWQIVLADEWHLRKVFTKLNVTSRWELREALPPQARLKPAR